MPTYEYRRADGSTFEVIQSMSEPPLSKDPETGQPVERVFHAPAIHFKGSGFYTTDYGKGKKSGQTNGKGEGSEGSSESKSDSKDSKDSKDGKTDGKSEKKSSSSEKKTTESKSSSD